MKFVRAAAFVALAAAAGQASSAPGLQPVSGPVAVYWMSASTTTGMGGMMGGGGRPSMQQMQAMMANPNAVSHSLILQLGSSRKPEGGDPTAEHDPPEGLGAGPVLPLVTPQAVAAHEEHEAGPPPQYQQPHGRMLIFWGCGEHAGPGQPFVLDFASLGAEKGGAQFMALQRGLAVTPMQPPSPARDATYGEWPNAQSETSIPPDGSLQGAHTIKGNYSPQINFTLVADQDFLPPFQMTSNVRNPSGSATLGWRHVDGSQGYFATMIGAQSQDEFVMWTSSENQASAFSLPDYLSDGEIARLVGAHVLMPPTQTECVIPQEAVQAAGGHGAFNLVAYGGETNLSSPMRPPPPQPWHVAWEVKIRYRSATSGIVGVDMSQMGGGQGQPGQQGQPQQQQPQHRPNPFGGLGGFIP